MKAPQHFAVVPAAGAGKRMGAAKPKQYLPLAGSSVIAHALAVLLRHPRIDGVVVVTGAGDLWWRNIRIDTAKPLIRTIGGEERCHSVLNGLNALAGRAKPDDWVLVHDAARPCLQTSDLDLLIETLEGDPVGGLLATPVRDTLKRADAAGRVQVTVDRRGMWHAMTPQMFRLKMLEAALRRALKHNLLVTDDASAIEAAGWTPRLVEGRASNIKITRPEDLMLAEFLLGRG
jgi:2-C-methyl-D-erythritol 4-phosphate cytidylyltransferase